MVTVSEDLQNLGIKNLIATGHTAFAGSHGGRVKNIEVGISRYNGLLVKKGEVFPSTTILGPVDGQHGFVQELVIKAEGTVPDYARRTLPGFFHGLPGRPFCGISDY